VLKAAEFLVMECVPKDDIRDLEKLMRSHVMEGGTGKEGGGHRLGRQHRRPIEDGGDQRVGGVRRR
jgi:hypothetical protein